MAKNIITIKEKPFLVHGDVLTPLDPSRVYEVIEKRTDRRTVLQNSAMHKYFVFISEALNSAGYSVAFVLNKKQHKLISNVFMWGKKYIPGQLHGILDKMEARLLQSNEGELNWNPFLVKELLWKSIQKALLGKESTSALQKGEIDIVYDNLSRLLAQKFGISIAFPSQEQMIFEQNYKDK